MEINDQVELLLMFTLALPLGAVYWFGLSFMQILAQLVVYHIHLVPLDYLGYATTAFPIIILDILMIREKEPSRRRLLLEGFIIASILQPIIFATWWYYSVYA